MLFKRGLTNLFFSANTKDFGKHLKDLRNSLGLTLKGVESQSGISAVTLGRIENGETMPRLDTLGFLSAAYKRDLLLDLRNYCNSNSLFSYYIRLEDLIISYDIKILQDLKSDFEQFINTSFNESLAIDTAIIKQFNLVLEGISQNYSGDPEQSFEIFLDAMKLTNPLFNVENFKRLRYSAFEMRILFLISLSIVNRQEIEQSNRILAYLLQSSNFDKRSNNNEKFFIIKIFLNLSYNYHRLDLHHKALESAKEGVNFCNNNHISYALAHLYARKGIAEYLLDEPNHIKSLEQCIWLLISTNQEELAKNYLEIIYNKYNITIPGYSLKID